MHRTIVDFKKLTPEILELLVEAYPDGYGKNDIIAFKNQHNEIIECVEVKTDETDYLVKISKSLVESMENFYDDDDDDDDVDPTDETILPDEIDEDIDLDDDK